MIVESNEKNFVLRKDKKTDSIGIYFKLEIIGSSSAAN